MSRPTVNDIAREAGVSLATVDRVLNARPGVRGRTVAAVNDAVARLGYVRDLAAANLARGRGYRMAVLLPDTASQFVGTLEAALREAGGRAASERVALDLGRFPAEDMHALAALLAGLPADTAGVALMAPETPVVRDAVAALGARGIPVAALVSDLPATGRARFVGVDNRAAGRTAGRLMGRFLPPGPARVMVLAQSMLQRDSIERRRGFDEALAARPEVEVGATLEAHGSAATLGRVVEEALGAGPAHGIYVLGHGHRALMATLGRLGMLGRPVVIGHELTPFTREALERGHVDAVIAQNMGHLARSALRVLRALADGRGVDEEQERLRIEIVIRENLPSLDEAGAL